MIKKKIKKKIYKKKNRKKKKEQKKQGKINAKTEIITEVTKETIKVEVHTDTYQKVFGVDAKPEIEVKLTRKCVMSKDLRGLVTYIFADGFNPTNTFHLKHKSLINHVVVVMLDCLSPDLFGKGRGLGLFNKMDKLFNGFDGWPCQPATSKTGAPLESFLSVPAEKTKSSGAKDKKKKPMDFYLLSDEELINHGFPQEGTSEAVGFFKFSGEGGYDVVAIDCEMCLSQYGFELTRISVIDMKENVLYDSYVKPANEIIDYLTMFSGITKEDLEHVDNTLEDVQKHLSEFISSKTIMVGHSLENDLRAMKVIHNRVCDTSVLYPNAVDSRKNALKYLASKFLNATIQNGSHNSVQDAIAAMRLFLLKVKEGPNFGMPLLKRDNLFDVLSKHSKKGYLIDNIENCKVFGGTSGNVVHCATDEEVLENTLKNINSEVPFILSRLRSLHSLYKETAENIEKTNSILTTDLEDIENPDSNTILQNFDNAIEKIYEKCLPNTLFIVWSGQGNITGSYLLNRAKKSSIKDKIPNFNDKLRNSINKGRSGIVFFKIKH